MSIQKYENSRCHSHFSSKCLLFTDYLYSKCYRLNIEISTLNLCLRPTGKDLSKIKLHYHFMCGTCLSLFKVLQLSRHVNKCLTSDCLRFVLFFTRYRFNNLFHIFLMPCSSIFSRIHWAKVHCLAVKCS